MKKIVVAEFNQQQYSLIQTLRKEKKFGRTDSEIVKSVFLDFVKRYLPTDSGGKK